MAKGQDMKCSVKNCVNDTKTLREGHGITFHKFPRDRGLRKVWMEVLGMFDNPELNSAVCSDHFRSEDIYVNQRGQPRIKDEALPVVVQVCRICLATDVKMYSIRDGGLRQAYADVCGIIIKEGKVKNKLPEKLCWECAARLLAGSRLRNRALTSHQLLTRLLHTTSYITLRHINSINRSKNDLESDLSVHYNEPDNCDMYIEEAIVDKPDNDDIIMEIEEKEIYNKDDFEEEYLEESNDVDEKNESDNDLNKDYEYIEVSDEAEDINDKQKDSENDKCIVLDEIKMQVNFKDDDDEQNDSDDRNEDSKNDKSIVLIENKMQVNKDDDEQNDSNHRNEVFKDKSNSKKVKLSTKVESSKKDDAKKKPIADRKKKAAIVESKLLDESMFTVTALGLQEQLEDARRRRGEARLKTASYRCAVCGLGFRRRGRYDAHMARHSELAGAFECSICARRQKSELALQRHLAGFHSRRYSCNQCSFVTQNRNTARDHQARHKGVKFQCPHCPCEFESRSTYVGHLRWKHRADFICELCGHTFLSKRGVAMHKNTIHRFADENMPLEGPYCKTCDVTFFSEDAHDRHLQFSSRHSDKYDLNQIRNDPNMLEGIRKSHKIVGRVPEIDSCDASDKDGTSGNEEVIFCEHCGSELPDFRLYAQHIRFMHPGKIRTQFSGKSETIICDQCGRIFQSTNVLRDHMSTHTGSKLFQCDHCYKKYEQKTDLIQHIKRNNHGYCTLAYAKRKKMPKKYACSICDKEFTNAGNRIKHMWTHTARKPFKCEACEKSFAYQSMLKAHFKKQHLEKTILKMNRKTSPGKRRRKTKAPVED